MRKYGLPVVVAINEFVSDTEKEITLLKELCEQEDVKVELASVWEKGPDGGIDLAKTLVDTIANEENDFHSIFSREHDDLTEKVETIVREIYGGNEVIYSKRHNNN